MARPTFKQSLMADMDIRRHVADCVRSRYGLQPDRDCRMQIVDRDYDNQVEVQFEFDRPKQGFPLSVTSLLDKVAEKLHDPFRGPVIAAAVPELHADLVALLTNLEKLDKPFRVAMKLEAVQQLMESKHV